MPKQRPTPAQSPADRSTRTGPRRSASDRYQQRLQIAEAMLRFGTWDWDLVTGALNWTPELEAIYGLEPGAFGRTYADFAQRVHPDDLGHAERERDLAVATGQAFDVTFRILRPDGEVRWVRSQGAAVRDPSGKAQRVVGINIDVTELKRTELALATHAARLQVALKLTGHLIFHQDRQLRYTWIANPTLGMTEQALIGRSDEQILGRAAARPLTAIKRRVLRSGRGERQEVWVSANGQTGCYDLVVEPERAADGSVTGIVCAASDITRRKRVEEHLELQARILDGLQEGVNLADEGGILRYTNPSFDRMFGYAPGELCGQPAAILNAPGTASPEDTAQRILRALQDQGRWSGSLRNRRKDGRLFCSHANIVGGHHPKFGRVWISLQSDITPLQEALAERDAAYRAIGRLADHVQDEVEHQRQELARDVHDQIGATLTGIRMQLHALPGETCRDELLEIRRQIDQALATTRTLCTRLRPPMLDDLGLAETLRWYARDWAQQTRIRIRIRIAELRPEPADPLRIDIFRMLQELLTNVARHAGAGQVSISLVGASGTLRLHVTDDGHGFPADHQSGFGLLGIRERLRRHGGDLQIASTGRGTRVTLAIPWPAP